jgi:hypothetical protein
LILVVGGAAGCRLFFDIDNARTVDVGAVEPKGERILGFDISNHGATEYGEALATVEGAGVELIDVHFGWDALETKEGEYGGLEGEDSFAFLNDYFGETSVALTLAVIDTNALTVPDHLSEASFTDMVEPFKQLLDKLYETLPNLKVDVLSIGNEIDVYLSDDGEAWQDWRQFYAQAASYAAANAPDAWTNMAVGSKTTLYGSLADGVRGEVESMTALPQTTGFLSTYYPLQDDFTMKDPAVVEEEVADLIAAFDKPIYILEAGYPTSSAAGGSHQDQVNFVHAMFRAWDSHATDIVTVVFSWYADLSLAQIDQFEKQYGISDRAFLAYLRTLGFFTYSGAGKTGWEQFVAEADARGW